MAETPFCFSFSPIGIFHCRELYPYDVPRQGVLAGGNTGVIELAPGHNFEQALGGLEGFSRLWVLFVFDRAIGCWHPKVRPPHHTLRRIGLFATRSPHRPNPIGLTCVTLQQVHDRRIYISSHDLLDGTPILDIKPYLPYADSFPEAATGWTRQPEKIYRVRLADKAENKVNFLEEHAVSCLRQFILQHLSYAPLSKKRHRLTETAEAGGVLAYRTWRIRFQCHEEEETVTVTDIFSGYATEELLADSADKYHDKALHRSFNRQFS